MLRSTSAFTTVVLGFPEAPDPIRLPEVETVVAAANEAAASTIVLGGTIT